MQIKYFMQNELGVLYICRTRQYCDKNVAYIC